MFRAKTITLSASQLPFGSLPLQEPEKDVYMPRDPCPPLPGDGLGTTHRPAHCTVLPLSA